MTSPECSTLLDLFQQIIAAGALLFPNGPGVGKRKSNRRVYSVPVVLWLMMLQRLQARGTLASAVQLLLQGAADPLLMSCRRVRHKQISSRTGAFCQARQNLSKLVCRQVSEKIVEQLRVVLNQARPAGRANVFVVDGSSIELEHDRQLLRR
jgi:hypothetical protein